MASRLLRSELNVDLSHIQIYPTNEYTPSVHRLLQVAANLYDATTNHNADAPFLPTVFRPVFSTAARYGSEIFISGYQEVNQASGLFSVPTHDLDDPADRLTLKPFDLVYGIPLVVGAKKGLPNFNELAVQTEIYVSRKLEFRRPTPNSLVNETNQMYVIGVSNVAGVEAWNSYTNPFPRALQLVLAADFTGVLTNETGVLFSNWYSIGVTSNLPPGWPGYNTPGAFQIPLSNGNVFLPVSTYQQSPPAFVALTNQFERGAGLPVPHWWWRLSTRLRFMLLDTETQRLIDYVNVKSSEQVIDITARLTEDAVCDALSGAAGSQWCTNRIGSSTSVVAPTYGIVNQIHVCDGGVTPDDWNNFNLNGSADKSTAIAQFRYQLYGISTPGYGPFYRSNIFQAPLDPYRRIYQHISWQANDPLVHYLASDLRSTSQTNTVDFIPQHPVLPNLGRLNQRYEPWGQFAHSTSPTLYDPTLKDPLLTRSDSWNFPENQPLDGASLGRVHRGTPWQTLYLKSDPVNPVRWMNWIGASGEEANKLQPTNDWRLVESLNSLLRTNDPRSLLSVNSTNAAAWNATLDGINVLSNNIADGDWAANPFLTPQFEAMVMASNSSQAAAIVSAIGMLHSNQPGQFFRSAGDLLAARELSFASPWLNLSSIQLPRAINDEAYERIPAQLLTRLRSDSVGTAARAGGLLEIRFSGFDEVPYAIQVSHDLSNWQVIGTNYPTNGIIILNQTGSNSPAFFRSVLLP